MIKKSRFLPLLSSLAVSLIIVACDQIPIDIGDGFPRDGSGGGPRDTIICDSTWDNHGDRGGGRDTIPDRHGDRDGNGGNDTIRDGSGDRNGGSDTIIIFDRRNF